MTTTVDLNNPEMARPFDPSAAWKRALIKHLAKLFSIPTLVETGTSWGDTIEDVRESFESVWSIELSPEMFHHAAGRFSKVENVYLTFGSSGQVLPSVIRSTRGKLMFWLDAHPTGEGSADNGEQLPMELAVISKMRPDSLVLVDDVKPGFCGPSGAQICIPDGWHTKFLHGVLIVHAGGYDIPERF